MHVEASLPGKLRGIIVIQNPQKRSYLKGNFIDNMGKSKAISLSNFRKGNTGNSPQTLKSSTLPSRL